MIDRATPAHLRLIISKSKEGNEVENAAGTKEYQLSFPYPETSTVFFIYVDLIGREEFARILSDYIPRWIFDVRTVPRLDTIAASRLSAFTLFEEAKISYVDLFGRLGINSYRSADSNPAFWSNAVVELLQKSKRKGPYVFLFDNEDLMKATDDILPKIMKPVIGKTAQFQYIRKSQSC